MKTFLALQEGFEHVAAIVRKEADKGPIVKDCLALLRNVVRGRHRSLRFTVAGYCSKSSALNLFLKAPFPSCA